MKNKKLLWGLRIAGTLAFASGYITDRILTVSGYEIRTNRLNGEKIRIVNISDLHNIMFGKDQEYLINEIKKLSPDIIVITGDIVHRVVECGNSLIFADKAVKLAPVFYVSGNHERNSISSDYSDFMYKLSRRGVTLLNDSYEIYEKNGSVIRISGLDNASLNNGTFRRKLKKLCTGDEYTVLLAHEPQYIRAYSRSAADLVLCGHAHGGQIRIPFIGGVFSPGQGLFPKYTEGKFTMNGTDTVISRGLGNRIWFCPRFFNPPEIVYVDLY